MLRGAHRGRQTGDVEQLIDEVRTVVEQHPAAPGRTRAAPRQAGVAGGATRIGGRPVDGEFGQVPVADGASGEPLLHLHPDRVVAVLVTRHHDATVGPGGGADPVRFDARQRDGLLAHDMVATLEPPERQVQVRCGRRADVDEIQRPEVRELLAAREQRKRVDRRHVGGAVYQRDHFQPALQGRGAAERGEMRLPRDPARSDEGPAVAPRLR